MSDTLTPTHIRNRNTAHDVSLPIQERISACGDLLQRPLPYGARQELNALYIELSEQKEQAACPEFQQRFSA